jgi:glycine C-acetyltransferase
MKINRAGKSRTVVNLSSYNYLGLAANPEVIEAGKKALSRYGTGACGSPMLSGMTDLHRELEHELAKFTGHEDVMLFNSGFGGGLGTLTGVLRSGDLAILDAKCHLCLIDGVKLAKAKLQFFSHNDIASLEELLVKSEGRRRLIVIEGVYSMDGDTAKLPDIIALANRHNVGIMIDEAHSILALGEHGRGCLEHYGLPPSAVGLQYATFSKSFAHTGSFVGGKRELIRYLRHYVNGYAFSCALPPVVVGGVLKALEISTRERAHLLCGGFRPAHLSRCARLLRHRHRHRHGARCQRLTARTHRQLVHVRLARSATDLVLYRQELEELGRLRP